MLSYIFEGPSFDVLARTRKKLKGISIFGRIIYSFASIFSVYIEEKKQGS